MTDSANTLFFGLDHEVAKFRSYGRIDSSSGQMQTVGPDVLKFIPKNRSAKSLKLGLTALIHGNEILGLPIMNTLIQALLDGFIGVDYEIYFGLGNLPAAYENKRFLQKDLNRCFGQKETETVEGRRARELEKYLLNEVDYLVDLHQTVQPVPSPFFIFQYASKNCFTHLALMNEKYPAVVQFEAIGDNEGLSADEYLRGLGRFGATFELGKIGFDDDKFHAGATACWLFMEKLTQQKSFDQIAERPIQQTEFPMFQMGDRFLATDDESCLLPSLQNFTEIEKGQVLGVSRSGPILAPSSGAVLFPKLDQKVKKGQSLFFVCRPLKVQQVHEQTDLQL
ncbi:MAG: hypothetical protein ACXWQQ_11000 [Pseudobdellovibrio sp.]